MPISLYIIFLLLPPALFLSNELTNEFSSGCCIDCILSLLYISTLSRRCSSLARAIGTLPSLYFCCVISCVCRTIAPFRWDWATAKLLSFSVRVCWCHCVMAKVWHVTKAWACWEWRRKAGKLPLSRDVGRKMASRNNDAYINLCVTPTWIRRLVVVCVCVCVCSICARRLSAGYQVRKASCVFFSFSFLILIREKFFLCVPVKAFLFR